MCASEDGQLEMVVRDAFPGGKRLRNSYGAKSQDPRLVVTECREHSHHGRENGSVGHVQLRPGSDDSSRAVGFERSFWPLSAFLSTVPRCLCPLVV